MKQLCSSISGSWRQWTKKEQMFGTIVLPVMVDADKSGAKIDKKQKNQEKKMIVVLFMEIANKGFKPLLRDLENDYVLGVNKYPATLVESWQVLMVYAEQPVYKSIMKKLKKKQLVETDKGSPEVAFALMKKTKMIKKGLCFHCGEKGHKASEGKKKKKEDKETAERDNIHMQQLLWMV
jgi:hypothetical protein